MTEKRIKALQDGTAVSPEVHGRHVTFRLLAPGASCVELALGYPYAEKAPLSRNEQGVWELTVGPLEPRLYSYYFYLNGTLIADPANPATGRRINLGYSLVDVPGERPRDDEPQAVPHGVLHRHYYDSSVMDQQRRLWVYTPPGYQASGPADERLPVIYLRHGAEHVEDSWFVAGRADTIADNLLHSQRALPAIIVTTNGYARDQVGGQLRGDRGAAKHIKLLGEELVHDIVPFIDAHYRTLADRSHRAIAGLSMGAGQSFILGMAHLDTFATIGAFSSGVVSAPQFDLAANVPNLVANPSDTNARLRLLWLGCGSSDRRAVGYARLREQLSRMGVEHRYAEAPGAHEWRCWRALFAAFLTEVFS